MRIHRSLEAAGVALKSAVLLLLYKVLQATVGALFIAFIVGQTGVAGVVRLLSRQNALRKVQAARQAQDRAVDPNCTPSVDACSRDNADSTCKPVHVFPDPQEGHDSLAWRLIGPYMRKYGRHAIANSQLFNPEYIHFFVPGVGSLPYVVADVYNRVVVVGTGEPLADRAAWRQLTELFLAEFPEAYFYHVTEEYADLLHDMGYYINCCGTETTLQVQSWTYSAKTRVLRAAARAARDAGVRVRELKPEELTDEVRSSLQHEISGCWRQQKAVANRELRVFVRDVDYDNLALQDGVRLFVAEAYDPVDAPPAYVDPVLQGAALNSKPPKPPRNKSARSLCSHSSAPAPGTARDKLRRAKSEGTALGSSNSCPTALGTHRSVNQLAGKPSTTAPQKSSAAAAAAAAAADAPGTAASTDTPTSVVNPGCAGGEAALVLPRLPRALSTDCGSGSTSPKSDCFATVDCSPHLQDQAGSGKHSTATKRVQIQCKSDTVRPDDGGDTAADTAAVCDQQVKPAGGSSTGPLQQSQLVGFVLLDPLWEEDQEVGYVASLMRMKRTAHSGTLKLLCEDIISSLRREGKKELTFGFAPLFNMKDDSGRRYLHWMRWTALYLYHCANNVYAFRNLAFSKIRYGAGLNKDGTGFNDPNVTLTHVYMATKYYTPGWSILDLYGFFAFVGIVDRDFFSIFLKLVGLRKGGENLT